MSDFTLYLDSVAFQHFEIPESIKAGGAQALFKHKYPGGARTIDTLGPDDDDITWSGTFLDGNAQDRCMQLDVMRKQGNQVVVTWGAYQYLVVVAEFKWDFRHVWEIPYTITLAVVQDETQPLQSDAPDVDSQTNSDALTAASDTGSISDSVATLTPYLTGAVTGAVQSSLSSAAAALSSAVGSVTSALSSVTSISNATVDVQASIGGQVQTALAASQSLQTTLDTTLTAAGNPALFASGTPPQDMIASLQNLAGLSGAMAASVDCSNTLGRMSINIGQLGS
ncbi:hypothetical protein P3T40_003389 [Paraburkholderia sp. EB58]|uniref:hypothetical protein n=1 Tax=Paraburkholderia sp. EB58 TaxID=3035125 RepID=UPI003D1C4909